MDGYERLQIAILQQAIKDYKTALKKNSYYSKRSLERWFLSDWGEMLSNNNGELIIEKCQKSVGMKHKPTKEK